MDQPAGGLLVEAQLLQRPVKGGVAYEEAVLLVVVADAAVGGASLGRGR